MDPITIAKLWLLIKPIDRIRLARARRRAKRLGLPPPDGLTDGGVVFPQGTMTKGGIVIMLIGAAISIGLKLIGVGECTPEELAQGCQGVTQLAPILTDAVGMLVGAGGAVIAWKGRNRATKILKP